MRTGPVEQNVTSLEGLEKMLVELCSRPLDFLTDSEVLLAVKSQHGLAKYASPARKIAPTSLNTQKRLSAHALAGGYARLDLLRRRAVAALAQAALGEKKSRKSARSVSGLTEKLAKLESELSSAQQDCWHLSSAFTRALTIAGNLVKNIDDAATQAGWVKSRRELLAMVSLSSRGNSFVQKPSANGDQYE
jgi:hypothetical protein